MKRYAAGLLIAAMGAWAQVVVIPDEYPATSLLKLNSNFSWLNSHINGTTVSTNNAADQVLLTTGPGISGWVAVPNCTTGVLQYAIATHTFSCSSTATPAAHASTHGLSGSDQLSVDGTQVASGTVPSARLPLAGASAPGVVRSADCSANGQFVQKLNTDGTITCATPAGSGNVSGPGSSTNLYIPQWSGTTGTLLTAGLSVVTSLGTPGANTAVPTEAAVRAAIPTALPPNGSASGDLGGSYPSPSVAKVNGVSYASGPATDTVPVVTAANTTTYTAVPTGMLKYSTLTHTFSAAAAGTDYVAPAGNAATATALAGTPTKCSAGSFPLGVDAGGNAQNCTAASGGKRTLATLGAVCHLGAAAGLAGNSGASGVPTVACVTGTDTPATVLSVLQFADSGTQSVQANGVLYADWAGTAVLALEWRSAVANAGLNVVWQVQTKCVGDGEAIDGVSWNAAQAVTDANKATANLANAIAPLTLTVTGCSAGEHLFLYLYRDPAHASDTLGATAELIRATVTE